MNNEELCNRPSTSLLNVGQVLRQQSDTTHMSRRLVRSSAICEEDRPATSCNMHADEKVTVMIFCRKGWMCAKFFMRQLSRDDFNYWGIVVSSYQTDPVQRQEFRLGPSCTIDFLP
ncbi:unnamed protein product [Anisakis simplex]|uniref:DSPn domain-containing protein n=1 Tax=Anisakis simplex TaxID=6269 RepID=A0A0M3K9V4_ANISI|nr:unnamed protein product [Anisakis simplex]